MVLVVLAKHHKPICFLNIFKPITQADLSMFDIFKILKFRHHKYLSH